MKNERIHSLDSLRGIAAFVVIIFHIMLSFNIFYNADRNFEYENNFVKIINESPLHLFWGGNEAVLLFFVLSGFVLAIPFQLGKAGSYSVFITKRFFRIYLPYIAVMAISVVLTMIFFEYKDASGMSPAYDNRWNHAVTWQAIIAYIFMINYDTGNVNGVVWTLYHEMRFSIVMPLIMLILMKYKPLKSLLILGISVISFMVFAVAPYVLFGSNIYTILIRDFGFTAYYTLFFISGAFLSVYRKPIINWIAKLSTVSKLGLFILSMILISCKWLINIIPIKSSLLIYSPVAGIGILLLFVLVLASPKAEQILTVRPLLFLGKISYSLYLVHMLVIMLLTIAFDQIGLRIWGFALSPFISIPVAYLAYKAFELPAIKLGRYYGNKVQEIEKSRTRNKASIV